MGALLRTVSYLSCVADFSGRIVWFSASYGRDTDALFTRIFPLSEAAFAAASHNAQWRYKFQKQIWSFYFSPPTVLSNVSLIGLSRE